MTGTSPTTTSPSIHTQHTAKHDLAWLLLRVWIGAMFIVHGGPKVFGGIPKLTATVTKLGFPFPEGFAWAAALSEFGGGILLVLGLGVRPATFFMGATMIVAAFIRHADDPFNKKELALTYLAVLIFFMVVGGGKYTAGWLLNRARGSSPSI